MARGKSEIYGQWLGGSLVMADQGKSTGSRFWVSSATGSDAAGYGLSPTAPTATLDYAIGLCTANKGDVIYVMPGHSEVFTATNGFDADVAGIRIVGLGWGSAKPTFSFNHANAQVNVGAAGVWIENLRFMATITAVTAGLQVEGVTDFTCKGCDWIIEATGDDFVISLELEAGSHRALIEGCQFMAEEGVAGAASAIKLTDASDNVTVRGCVFTGDYSVACLNGTTALSKSLMFLDNLVHNLDAGEPYLEVFTGTTGVIANTRGLASGATIAANAVADAMAHCENFVVNTAGTIAIIKGAGGSPALDAD